MIIFSSAVAEEDFLTGVSNSLASLMRASDQAIEDDVLRGHHQGLFEYLFSLSQAVFWGASHAFFEQRRILNRGYQVHETVSIMARVYQRLLDSGEWDGTGWEIALRRRIEFARSMT